MKRPLAFIGFSVAITLLLINFIAYKFYIVVFVSAVVLFAASLLIKKTRQAAVVPLVFCSAVFACLIFMFTLNFNVSNQLKLDDTQHKVTFNIVDLMYKSDDSFVYAVKTKAIDDFNAPQNIKLKVYSDKELDADYYDDITAELKFTKSGENSLDSYGSYADSRYLFATVESYAFVNENKSKPLNYYIIKIREYVKNSLALKMKNDTGALCTALLIGDKNSLSNEANANFSLCGVSHIMAVSGLHTSVICMGFYTLLKYLGVKRKVRIPVSLAILLFYVALAGFSKSVVRSAVTIAVLLLSQFANRKADTLNSLGFATLVLCFNPFAVTDISALLTVNAVLGMVVVKPFVDKYFKPKSKAKIYLYNSAALTFSIMVTTFPIMWIFFKNISFIAFFANIVIIPLAQVAMIASLIAVIFSFNAVLSFIPVFIAYCSSKLMLIIVDFLADTLWFLNVDMGNIVFILAYCALLFLVGISVCFKLKINAKIMALTSLILFVFSCSYSSYINHTSDFVTITSTQATVIYNDSAVVVINANKKNDYYNVKSSINTYKPDHVLFVDCNYDKKKLSLLAPNEKEFYNNTDFDIDLCDTINVKCQSGIIYADVDGNNVTVDKRYVHINSQTYLKNIKYIYDKDDNSTLRIKRK